MLRAHLVDRLPVTEGGGAWLLSGGAQELSNEHRLSGADQPSHPTAGEPRCSQRVRRPGVLRQMRAKRLIGDLTSLRSAS